MIGVAPDDATRHANFRRTYGLGLTLLSDPDQNVMTRYGAFDEKMLYGKRVLGVVRTTFSVRSTGASERARYNARRRSRRQGARGARMLIGVLPTHRAHPVPESPRDE